METDKSLVNLEKIEKSILIIREQRVMLDNDLAELYGVETRILNQAVRRNMGRFPADFMFQLSTDEAKFIRSQFVTLEKGRGRHRKYLQLRETISAHKELAISKDMIKALKQFLTL